jgi:hypothetical protein
VKTSLSPEAWESLHGSKTRLTRLENAKDHLRGLRYLVREGGAPQTYKKYCSLLKSLDGAIRNAARRVESHYLCHTCNLPLAHTAGPEKGECGLVCQTPGCDEIEMEDPRDAEEAAFDRAVARAPQTPAVDA